MSLDFNGFHQSIQAGDVTIVITEQHPLIKLAKALPWDDFLQIILPNLQCTEKSHWWTVLYESVFI